MDENSIKFSGEIDVEIEREFRDLYYKRHPLYPFAFSLFGCLIVSMGIFMLITWEVVGSIVYGVIIVLVSGLGLFVLAFRRQHLWWRWWWPKFLAAFGRLVDGEVTEIGIKFKPDGNLVEWKYIMATKQTTSLILLYFDQASAYPIHRSMVNDLTNWEELKVLTKKHVKRKLM